MKRLEAFAMAQAVLGPTAALQCSWSAEATQYSIGVCELHAGRPVYIEKAVAGSWRDALFSIMSSKLNVSGFENAELELGTGKPAGDQL